MHWEIYRHMFSLSIRKFNVWLSIFINVRKDEYKVILFKAVAFQKKKALHGDENSTSATTMSFGSN